MREGIYESLVTASLLRSVEDDPALVSDLADVDPADQPSVLTRHVAQALLTRLEEVKDPDARLEIVHQLLKAVDQDVDRVDPRITQLQRLSYANAPGTVPSSDKRPRTPLSDAALLTNAHGEPSLGTELRAEIETADRVDLLCAFVKWHGVRLLEPELKRLRDRGKPFRVVTTTYMGATEREALDRLVREFGAEVSVQYDALRTRLHAKAWLFQRDTGFDTAYVGSSNLSRAALLDGVEWNVRLSRVANPHLLNKFGATFDTYWNDPYFERYDPDGDRDRLDDAIAEASGRTTHSRVTLSLSGLEVRGYPYQLEMIEALDAERVVHDRHRNLVVAATGTGKTVVAALDYRAQCDAAGPAARPSLLFVAHRKEILEQSLRTYREVLADPTFGELYVGGARPERWRHVFASVQSLHSYGVDNIPSDAYDVVVIDEFHHAQAATYRKILGHLAPKELLGLTATPERADGTDVRSFFGGRTAVELRLWDALNAELLCPFHYFAVADGTDLREVSWKQGRYDEAELSNVFTGNNQRVRVVLGQLRDKVLDPGAMRALGFCVSVAHAEFMANAFNAAGIPARAVSGTTPPLEREQALTDLREKRVNVLFAADLFNEGLDLPDVDTVLFLRPTESATIFLQQLGRGLRQTRDKAVLTVLDFVGYHRKEFRWDLKLRALTGRTRRGLERDIANGFPFLPSGCQIVLDKTTQAVVLTNIKSQVASRWAHIVAELRSYGDQDLPTFLEESGIEFSDILRRGTWTRLRRDAGLETRAGSELEDKLLKRVRAFTHVDDRTRVETYRRILSDLSPSYDELAENEQRLARMLFFSLWRGGGGHSSFADGLNALRSEPAVRDEIGAVIDMSFDAARRQTTRLSGPLAPLPLRVHARYQLEEVLAGIDYVSMKRKADSFREGVLHQSDLNLDVFFVTFVKSEADYSPTTMYRDYPISPTLLHWESQSRTTINSPTGQRYINGTSNVLIFARQEPYNEYGTAPYVLLGPAHYVTHSGERPISITWKLGHPMPIDLFNSASVVAG
jgi:superfamily II DNA or RNA helicase/HKD family nuclease